MFGTAALPVVELKGPSPRDSAWAGYLELFILPTWAQSCRFLSPAFLKARNGFSKEDQTLAPCQLGREADQQKDGKCKKIQPPGPVYIRCHPPTHNGNLDRLGHSILSRYQDKACLSRYCPWEFGSRPYNNGLIPSTLIRKGISLDSFLFPML